MAGFGAAGHATRRDLSALARALFWALIGLIVLGTVTIFIQIPNGALIYAVLGLVIFAGLAASDFQRLRRSRDIRRSWPRIEAQPGHVEEPPASATS
jgi:FtsH-binding integral membrane protein